MPANWCSTAIRCHQVQQQPGKGGFAAAGFANNAQGFALADSKRDAVYCLHRFAAAAFRREVLSQIARNQQRLLQAAAVARIESEGVVHRQAYPSTSERPLPRATRR